VLNLHNDTSIPVQGQIIDAKADVGKLSYHSQIGGVAFEAVAKPAGGLENKTVSLDFQSNKFTVTVDGKTFYPKLPDWQLIPIAAFADSPYNVAFSALGDTTDNRQAQCLYHPAFWNTLCGLRIFQADVLNIPGVLWDLPKDNSKNYILADSEKSYTPEKDSIINKWLYDALSGNGRQFTSFVLTDKDENFVFSADGSFFKISGHPYYYFTKNVLDEQKISRLKSKSEEAYKDLEENAAIFLGEEYTPDLNPKTNLAGLKRKIEANKDKAKFNQFPYYKIGVDFAILDSLNNLPDSELGVTFKTLDSFTETFRSNWSRLKRYNPTLYSSLEDIARWTAFFRYVKKTNPENWTSFVQKVQKKRIADAPTVNTPTSFGIDYLRIFSEKVKRQEIY
jgi:hypothetical protein